MSRAPDAKRPALAAPAAPRIFATDQAARITRNGTAWVSAFIPGGIIHVPTDTPRGQQILADLIAAGWQTGSARSDATCQAPRALFPNLICGNTFRARKGQDYCSQTCAKRARRQGRQKAACPSESPFWTQTPEVPFSTDIRSDLPGAPERPAAITVPLFEVTS